MVRILGNNLSNKKKIYIALTSIYGIGIPTSKQILKTLNMAFFGITALGPPNIFKSTLVNALGK